MPFVKPSYFPEKPNANTSEIFFIVFETDPETGEYTNINTAAKFKSQDTNRIKFGNTEYEKDNVFIFLPDPRNNAETASVLRSIGLEGFEGGGKKTRKMKKNKPRRRHAKSRRHRF